MTIAITIDDRTEAALRALSSHSGADVADLAARLLARAVRAATPRRPFEAEGLKGLYARFEGEDLALAESDPEHRFALLEDEDRR